MEDAHEAAVIFQDVPRLFDLLFGPDTLEIEDVPREQLRLRLRGEQPDVPLPAVEIAPHPEGFLAREPSDVLPRLRRAVHEGQDGKTPQERQNVPFQRVLKAAIAQRSARDVVVDEPAVIVHRGHGDVQPLQGAQRAPHRAGGRKCEGDAFGEQRVEMFAAVFGDALFAR